MKGFLRTPAPAVLLDYGPQWTQQWIERRQQNPAADFRWYQHEKRSVREWLLPALREMSDGHCSFCEAFPLEGQSNEPIEHFRPKSAFPEHAYEWKNLYYCCETCQSSKGDRWDDGLLAPDAPDYRWADWFEFDYTTGSMVQISSRKRRPQLEPK